MSNIVIASTAPKHGQARCLKCKTQCEFPLPSLLPATVACHACTTTFQWYGADREGAPTASPPPASRSGEDSSSSGGKRRSAWGRGGSGTDEKPASMTFYDLLEVPANATQAEIKKKYYRLAIKYHPDKNKDEGAEERFKEISKAYQVLSDPELRKRYNQTGDTSDSPEGGFMDPSEFFRQQFGGDRFVDIIGNIGLAQDFADMVEEKEGDEGEASGEAATDGSVSPLDAEGRKRKEEQLRAQKVAREEAYAERVRVLTENLKRKLNIFVYADASAESLDAFTEIQKVEADDLKDESYGVELLHAIGYTYSLKAQQHLGRSGWGGLPNLYHQMREKSHIVSETVSTIRTAVDLQRSFNQLQMAEKEGKLTDEEKLRLEAEATQQGMKALWKGSKLEVQGVLREVCDNVLGDPEVSKAEAKKRATALKIVGECYMAVKADA